MTQSPARAGVPPDALELLTAALTSFQEQVQAVPSLDLAAVVEAARPAFASGIAFSATGEEWADEVDDLLRAAGWMLAMLPGIPLAKQAQPSEPHGQSPVELADMPIAADAARPSPASQEEASPVADLDVALEPLTSQEIEATHQRILALPQASRQQLTKAFREHFQVPRNARSIGDRITQHQHAGFIDHFLEECEEQGLDGAMAPAEP
ncbi:MAG: hypothetical protein WD136_03785 [Cyanobium sp.]